MDERFKATMSALGTLTEEQKIQAFLKARAEVILDEGKLVRITEEHYKKVLDFLRDHFIKDEPLHREAGAKWGKEAREVHMESICQNISVMIVDEESGDIISLLTNQVMKIGQLYEEEDLDKENGLITVWKFENICERNAKVFEYFNVDEAVQLFSLVTHRKYRQRGFGAKVVKASLAMVRNFGVGKICVKAEGSSLLTQKIFEREGMICVYKRIYMDHEINGKRVFEGFSRHDSFKQYGMMVES